MLILLFYVLVTILYKIYILIKKIFIYIFLIHSSNNILGFLI
jgi:hypothetical protein